MKHIIETGTDAATVCFFDPAALPADFDEQSREHPWEVMEELAKEGRIWFQETGGDGGYLFHFYVDEEIPENIREQATEPQEIARFLAPGGAIWACGAEYAARNPVSGHDQTPRGGLGRHPHMGGRFELRAGEYALTAWRTDWPDEMLDNALKKKLGSRQVNSTRRLGIATGVLFVGTLIGTAYWVVKTLANLAARVLPPGLAVAWIALLISWGVCIYFMRRLSKAEKNPIRREIEHGFPNIVVRMRKLN